MFKNEAIPVNGTITLSDEPGFGLELNRDAIALSRPYNGT
jgi:L-rhamnonate dehydratase